MKIKTRELEGSALDWAVAQVTGVELDIIAKPMRVHIGIKGRTADGFPAAYSPSTDWSQGGPLIEHHRIELSVNAGEQHGEYERWHAVIHVSATGARSAMGSTPLVAAMRALCAAKLGDVVEVQEELTPCDA